VVGGLHEGFERCDRLGGRTAASVGNELDDGLVLVDGARRLGETSLEELPELEAELRLILR